MRGAAHCTKRQPMLKLEAKKRVSPASFRVLRTLISLRLALVTSTRLHLINLVRCTRGVVAAKAIIRVSAAMELMKILMCHKSFKISNIRQSSKSLPVGSTLLRSVKTINCMRGEVELMVS